MNGLREQSGAIFGPSRRENMTVGAVQPQNHLRNPLAPLPCALNWGRCSFEAGPSCLENFTGAFQAVGVASPRRLCFSLTSLFGARGGPPAAPEKSEHRPAPAKRTAIPIAVGPPEFLRDFLWVGRFFGRPWVTTRPHATSWIRRFASLKHQSGVRVISAFRVALVAAVVIFAGCSGEPDPGPVDSGHVAIDAGPPLEAYACSSDLYYASLQCWSSSLMLECRGDSPATSRVHQIPCRGSLGCFHTTDGKIACQNTSNIQDGDGCGTTQADGHTCSADAGVRFRCTDAGFFVGEHCDGGCSVTGSSVFCN